jgi:hypothetical protein
MEWIADLGYFQTFFTRPVLIPVGREVPLDTRGARRR